MEEKLRATVKDVSLESRPERMNTFSLPAAAGQGIPVGGKYNTRDVYIIHGVA